MNCIISMDAFSFPWIISQKIDRFEIGPFAPGVNGLSVVERGGGQSSTATRMKPFLNTR
jgi:hypothetical protein